MPLQRLGRWFGVGLLGIALLIEAPFFWEQARMALSDRYFDPDTFTLYAFFRYYDPTLFTRDYTADYFLSLWVLPGFGLLQRIWAACADPVLLHHLLPILLWLSCIPLVYRSAERLGGKVNANATVALYLGSSIFIFRIMGGLAHGFGFPLAWAVVAALLSGRPFALAVVTLASAVFYPIIAPVAGITLALWLLFPSLAPAIPRHSTLFQLAWWKRLLFLALVAAVAACLMLPMYLNYSHTDYGQTIVPRTDSERFPEIKNVTASINPFFYFMVTYALQNSVRLGMESGQLLTLAIFGLLLVSILFHDARDRRPGSLKPFIYASGLCFLLSFLFSYDNTYRFVIYTLPVLITLWVPLGLRRLCRGVMPKGLKNMAFALVLLSYIFCIAKPDPTASGYLFELQDFQVRALEYIKTLPKDTTLAGWPGDRYGRIVEMVPYVAKRQVLVSWAGHLLTHSGYILTMRERMNAVVDAYLAREPAPLIRLRDDFHVDYLVVNAVDFAGTNPPTYIEPFSSRAKRLWENNPDKKFIVLKLARTIAVYARDDVYILDLHQLK